MNHRFFLLGLCLMLAALGCNNRETDSGKTFAQLNWYPESEHGGLYQALADGTYAEAGLDVEIRPGGGPTPVAPELVLGRVQFAVTNADDVVLFRAQGADVVAVLAAMQNHPRCILVREDSGIQTLDDLAGVTLQRNPGRVFLQFMRSKGLLDQVTEVPYHNSVTSLVTSQGFAIQAYSFAEPHLAEQQGVKVRKLMLSDIGWNPYSSVLVTSGKMIRTEPERVRQFVQATRTGWQNYLTDPTKGNAAILAANQHGMTAEALQFGEAELRTLALPNNQPMESIGEMTHDRWQTLVDQMQDLDVIEKGVVDPNDCFTTEFLK
ncbi:NMT1/THI5 like protein [Novipirellula aureliae]|uniref:NMT1/THI5 like protein n=1 Tax=Novipirellula aureliae TaxID=2527966 RepID=A0A5C6EC52_9BACT|nr:ABC transporter substrate-binding protein [Novipirellula aureliae]TWU46055.1 NMT1/THI5 like protein [Novipirellula aureliae]